MTLRPLSRLHSVFAFTLVLAPGCAVDAGPEDDPASSNDEALTPTLSLDELVLIAEAKYEGGSLRYYDVNGALLEQETGDAEHLRGLLPNEAHLSAADKYTAVAGKPAPERLVALTAAYDEADDEPDADGSAVPRTDSARQVDKDLGVESGALDFPTFYGRYCQPTDNYWERVLWPMATRRKQGKSRYYRFGVHAYAGSVRWKFLFNGVWIGDSLAADHFVAFRLTNGWPGSDAESKAEQEGPAGGLITHCVNSHD